MTKHLSNVVGEELLFSSKILNSSTTENQNAKELDILFCVKISK